MRMTTSFARLLNPLRRRVALMIGRGVVRLVNDSLKLQGLQVSLLAGETHDDVERFQEYGFSSHPHPGAEAVLVFAGGNRSHGLVIAVDDRRYRLKGLAEGEVALFDDLGTKLHLKRGGIIEATASTQITVTAPLAYFSGQIQAAGHITDNVAAGTGRSMASMRSTYNGHTHPEHGSTTSPPNQGM